MLLPIILSPGPWRHFWDLPWETPTLRSPRHLSFSVTDVKTIEVPYTKSFSSRDKLFCSQRTRQKLQSFRFYKSGFSISTIFDSDFFAARHTIKVHSTPEPLNKGFFFVSTSFWKDNKLQIFSQCTANEYKKKKTRTRRPSSVSSYLGTAVLWAERKFCSWCLSDNTFTISA